jgi:hypothetical protein
MPKRSRQYDVSMDVTETTDTTKRKRTRNETSPRLTKREMARIQVELHRLVATNKVIGHAPVTVRAEIAKSLRLSKISASTFTKVLKKNRMHTINNKSRNYVIVRVPESENEREHGVQHDEKYTDNDMERDNKLMKQTKRVLFDIEYEQMISLIGDDKQH